MKLKRILVVKMINNWNEAYAVLFAFAKWGQLWTGHTVTIMFDNTIVIDWLIDKSNYAR